MNFYTKNGILELFIFWGWFKSLITFRRRTYDNKLFAIRRFHYKNHSCDKKVFWTLAIWFLELHYYKEK